MSPTNDDTTHTALAPSLAQSPAHESQGRSGFGLELTNRARSHDIHGRTGTGLGSLPAYPPAMPRQSVVAWRWPSSRSSSSSRRRRRRGGAGPPAAYSSMPAPLLLLRLLFVLFLQSARADAPGGGRRLVEVYHPFPFTPDGLIRQLHHAQQAVQRVSSKRASTACAMHSSMQ